jgi:hypothetical protein
MNFTPVVFALPSHRAKLWIKSKRTAMHAYELALLLVILSRGRFGVPAPWVIDVGLLNEVKEVLVDCAAADAGHGVGMGRGAHHTVDQRSVDPAIVMLD